MHQIKVVTSASDGHLLELKTIETSEPVTETLLWALIKKRIATFKQEGYGFHRVALIEIFIDDEIIYSLKDHRDN